MNNHSVSLKRARITKVHLFSLLLLTIFLSACGGSSQRDSAPSRVPDVSKIPDAVPKNEPKSKYGNPKHYEVFGKSYYPMSSAEGYQERGIASWYGTKFHGRKTSSGEVYDMYAMTAAHKTLPLPTYVHVKNLQNGKTAIVKVNDRGPFHGNRLIDLSYSAATKLGIIAKGTGMVEITAITPGKKMAPPTQSQGTTADETVKMYLQVGAFTTQNKAEQVKTKLTSATTKQILIVPFNRIDGRIYRVRIGPLSSVEEGDSMATNLEHYGIYDAHIVIE